MISLDFDAVQKVLVWAQYFVANEQIQSAFGVQLHGGFLIATFVDLSVSSSGTNAGRHIFHIHCRWMPDHWRILCRSTSPPLHLSICQIGRAISFIVP